MPTVLGSTDYSLICGAGKSIEENDFEKNKIFIIKFDLLKGKITVPDDFNEPLDDFKEYMY